MLLLARLGSMKHGMSSSFNGSFLTLFEYVIFCVIYSSLFTIYGTRTKKPNNERTNKQYTREAYIKPIAYLT